MLDAPRTERLLRWSLAAFHTTFLVAVLVVILYRAGSLGDGLAKLNTAAGLLTFGVLWATTWWSTSRGLRGIAWLPVAHPVPVHTTLYRGIIAGGINGVLFLVYLQLLVNVLLLSNVTRSQLAEAGLEGVTEGILGIIFANGVGFAFRAVVASMVGAAAGLLIAAIDTAILELSRLIMLRCTAPAGDAAVARGEMVRTDDVTY